MKSMALEQAGINKKSLPLFGSAAVCSNRIGALGIILVGFSLLIAAPSFGQTLDYSVSPKANDNFLEASFRFTRSQGEPPSNTVLVYVPGTDGDGRDVVNSPEFLRISMACHANLLGCYYRGEGLSYDDPTHGSGRALNEAIAYFAAKTGQSQLSQATLLLIGFSQGGMFVFNYVCWHPERVKAFASLRAIFPRFEPQATSLRVPGLLAAGEYDQPGRVRSIAVAFGEAKGQESKWAFLWEKRSGHDVGRSVELAGSLFEAISRNTVTNPPRFLDTMGREVADPSCNLSNLCWFPNQNVADFWKSLHRPETFENLVSLPDRSRWEDLISIQGTPHLYQCKNGSSEVGSIYISARNAKVAIGRVKVTGDGFTYAGSSTGRLPAELKVCFAPKNMPWGETRAHIVVTGQLNGQDGEAVGTTLFGMVRGDLTPIPSTAYLGITIPGQAVQKTILLKSNHTKTHFAGIRVPEGITVTLAAANRSGDLLLNIHWIGGTRFGRMQGEIELSLDVPDKGTLRIPIVGFVAQASSGSSNRLNPVTSFTKSCWNSLIFRSPLRLRNGYETPVSIE